MKRRVYFFMLMGVAFLLMINGIAIGASHEQPACTEQAGPPIVGTLILDPVSDPIPLCVASGPSGCIKKIIFVNFKFSGCCAECSAASCKPACNVNMNKFEPFAEYFDGIEVTEHDGVPGLTLADAVPAALEGYHTGNVLWIPKNCQPPGQFDTLVKNIGIATVWKMTPKDIDNDGVQELLAETIVLFDAPIPCPPPPQP